LRGSDAVALVCEDKVLTYAALNRQANQLAHSLKGLGVGPDVLVGICMERSIEMVTALLAVLKAGGAYVPLDPSYPKERLAYLLMDSQSQILLTQSHLLELLPDHHAQIVCVDEKTLHQFPEQSPQQDLFDPNQLAYVIYTSGSTGQPKGVQITHANVCRLFKVTTDHFHFQPSDVWTLFHSYAFDFSVWEIWGALLFGGRLVVVPYWLSRSPDAFWQELEREQVTILSQTPSAFRQLTSERNPTVTGACVR
jgi:non-ribosomal peptide synthetase component F